MIVRALAVAATGLALLVGAPPARAIQPTRTGETGFVEVPSAEVVGAGDAALGADLRFDRVSGTPARFGPYPIYGSAGITNRLELGFSMRQWGQPGDEVPQRTALAAAAKLQLVPPRDLFPGIAIDVSVDRMNLDPVAGSKLIGSLRAPGDALGLAGFVGGELGPRNGLTYGAALSVAVSPRIELIAEALGGPRGQNFGGAVRMRTTPTSSLSLGFNYLPGDDGFRVSLGITFTPPRAMGEAPRAAPPPAPAPAGPAAPEFRDDRPRFRLKRSGPQSSADPHHFQYGPSEAKPAAASDRPTSRQAVQGAAAPVSSPAPVSPASAPAPAPAQAPAVTPAVPAKPPKPGRRAKPPKPAKTAKATKRAKPVAPVAPEPAPEPVAPVTPVAPAPAPAPASAPAAPTPEAIAPAAPAPAPAAAEPAAPAKPDVPAPGSAAPVSPAPAPAAPPAAPAPAFLAPTPAPPAPATPVVQPTAPAQPPIARVKKTVAAATLVPFPSPSGNLSELDGKAVDDIAQLAAKEHCELFVWARAADPSLVPEAQRRAAELRARALAAARIDDQQLFTRITTRPGAQGVDVVVSALCESEKLVQAPVAVASGPSLLPGQDGERQVREAVKAAQPSIEACVEEAITTRDLAQAEGVLKLSVSASGRVTKVVVGEGDLGGPQTEACLAGAAAGWSFPPAEAEYVIDVPIIVIRGGAAK